ncbi:MAG: hydrogenase maturation protease [Dehalococcoidales bacterium]
MVENKDFLPEYCSRPTLILGCGNILLGDDGFGPEVIAYLQAHSSFQEEVSLMDAGTGVIDILFNIALSEVKPRRIVLVDTMESGLPPGKLSLLRLEAVRARPLRTYSQHYLPTSTLLKELQEIGGLEVEILVMEPENIPEEIQPGLSPKAQEAVARACEIIVINYFRR